MERGSLGAPFFYMYKIVLQIPFFKVYLLILQFSY